MSHDLYGLQSKGSDRARKAEAIARTCRLDAEDEAKAMSVYEGMLDALADRMARHAGAYAPKPALVYIAAYQHRYGVDLSAHASRDQAEARLLSIAWQQCMSDAAIRAAVDADLSSRMSRRLSHPSSHFLTRIRIRSTTSQHPMKQRLKCDWTR